MPDRPELPEEALKFFRETGREGGLARARNHSPEKLTEWGKKGGRPKGKAKKQQGAKGDGSL